MSDAGHEVAAASAALSVTSTLLAAHDWEALRDTLHRAEALGPIIFPTEYREQATQLHLNLRVVNATITYLRELETVYTEATGRQPPHRQG